MKLCLNHLGRSLNDFIRFQNLTQNQRSIVFYAEDRASWVYFEPLIKTLTGKFNHEICYMTSAFDDPILSTDQKRIQSFYLGNGVLRILFFYVLKADVCVMTMPDLEVFHIKRSKLYPVHYVYVFHSMVSTHLAYRHAAFDYFDTIFCVGPHHIKEIRATEKRYGLKQKNLVEQGYGRLDTLLEEKSDKLKQTSKKNPKKKRILLAPSWGQPGLLERYGEEIIQILLQAGYEVVVRPHPVTVSKCSSVIQSFKDRFSDDPNFVLETDIASIDSLKNSDCLISDWSGVTLEYAFAFEHPVLFIDVPKKINNPRYMEIECEPLEVSIRTQIGEVLDSDHLEKIPEKIESLCGNLEQWQKQIQQIRKQTVFNINQSGEIGALQISKIADQKKDSLSLP